MVQFAGKYTLESSENFDNFLSELGVGFVVRNLAKASKPEIHVEVRDDGTYVIKTVAMLKTSVIEFKLGEEFQENRMDGKTVKTVVNLVGEDTLVQIQYGDKEVKIERKFTDDGMKTVCTVGNVVSTRIYKRA